ncbi:MAG: glycerophosphodiester phosphodiesterase [Acidimicrobiia bacterium]
MTPITFAHRGARSELPENTLPSFRRALELGARGLESDAHLSVDGEAVLVHDPVFRRGLRRIKVEAGTAAALEQYDIPRLTDLYRDLGASYELSIDLKTKGVDEPILAAARAVGAVERLWLCSPSVSRLRALREQSSAVKLVHSTRRSSITGPVERYAANLAEAHIDVVNFHHTEWTAGLVQLFHRFGVRTFAWDLQEVRHIRAALKMDLDGIYSDFVDRMVATVAEWKE